MKKFHNFFAAFLAAAFIFVSCEGGTNSSVANDNSQQTPGTSQGASFTYTQSNPDGNQYGQSYLFAVKNSTSSAVSSWQMTIPILNEKYPNRYDGKTEDAPSVWGTNATIKREGSNIIVTSIVTIPAGGEDKTAGVWALFNSLDFEKVSIKFDVEAFAPVESEIDKDGSFSGNGTIEGITVPISGKAGDKVKITFTVTGGSNYKQMGFQTSFDNYQGWQQVWEDKGLSNPQQCSFEVEAAKDFSQIVFKCLFQEPLNQNQTSSIKITNIKAQIVSNGSSGGDSSGSSGDDSSGGEQAPVVVPTVSGGSFSDHGKLSVSGTHLVDKNNKNFILRGVSTHGINWDCGYPFVKKEAFQNLRDEWGVNAVRLAMYTVEYNGYCSGNNKAGLKKIIDDGVQAATELGMYVIIDWHILNDLTPQTHKAEAKKFFTEMASKYKNYDNVLYEICNEPNGGTQWSEIKSYAEEVIPIIRQYAADAIIIVGTPNWSQDVDVASNNKISSKNSHNVMYTVHFYSGTHGASFRQKVQTALNNGLPVFCTEFGISQASGNGGVFKDEAVKWLDFFDKNGISYFCWAFANKSETSNLIKGGQTGWTSAYRSEAGKWLVEQYNARNGK